MAATARVASQADSKELAKMIDAKKSTGASGRRRALRGEYWKNDDAWTGDNEKGWFRAPRTLPLVLGLLGQKELSGTLDPTKVYLELLARHIDNGIIEMAGEPDHAYAAGYLGTRGVRTWQERMQVLEKLGLIRSKHIGNQRHKYVLLIHPTVAIQRLYEAKKVPQQWYDTFRARQIETGDVHFESRKRARRSSKQAGIATLLSGGGKTGKAK
jgi:hypothetical protein